MSVPTHNKIMKIAKADTRFFCCSATKKPFPKAESLIGETMQPANRIAIDIIDDAMSVRPNTKRFIIPSLRTYFTLLSIQERNNHHMVCFLQSNQ